MLRLADILIFVGPSGSGKSTLISCLQREWPHHFRFSVSHTTRPPREGEIDGAHYHFVSRDTFQRMIAEGEFLEYSYVFGPPTPTPSPSPVGNMYGTSKWALREALANGQVVLMDTDIKGAMNIRRFCSSAMCEKGERLLRSLIVFVRSPDMTVLERRLRQRGTESEASIQERLQESRKWLEWYEINPNCFDHALVNDEVERCCAELKRFVKERVMPPLSAL